MNQVLTRRRGSRPLFGLHKMRRRGDTRAPIGRDFADSRFPSQGRRWGAAALAAGVLLALAIVHVRVRLIEEGYLRAANVEQVEMLLARRQELKAETGALRDRNRLKALASERGFERPERELWLSNRPETAGRRRSESLPNELPTTELRP